MHGHTVRPICVHYIQYDRGRLSETRNNSKPSWNILKFCPKHMSAHVNVKWALILYRKENTPLRTHAYMHAHINNRAHRGPTYVFL